MRYTPGPWEIVQDAPQSPKARFQIGHRGDNGFATYVCTVKTERHLIRDGNEAGNARLIAAAPDMLNGLKELELRCRQFIAGDLVTFPCALLPQVRALIEAASGEAVEVEQNS